MVFLSAVKTENIIDVFKRKETSLTARGNEEKKVCAVDLHQFSCHE